MQPILTEQQIRDEIRRLDAEAKAAQEEGKDLEQAREQNRERRRSLEAQFGALRVFLREWHGKDVGQEDFPNHLCEIPF